MGKARAAVIVAVVGLAPALAFAQGAGPQPVAPPADSSAPAASDSARPVVPATGYGWSTKPAKGAGHPAGRVRIRAMSASKEPIGTVIPGFETLADGSSRVFVQLPRQVSYAAKPAKGSITYVLKGVRIDRRNNLNALVTVHFNTPVSSARLVPHGGDLWLVIDLRAPAQPTVAMDATKDGAMLRIEFPKGDYLGGGAAQIVPMAASPAASGSAAPPAAGAPASH